MNKEAFTLGFVKSAMDAGLPLSQVSDLWSSGTKTASRLGTYFSSGAIPREEASRHPWRSGALASLPYGAVAENVVNDIMGGHAAKKEDPHKQLNAESYGSAFARRGVAGLKRGLVPAGVLAAIAAGIAGQEAFASPTTRVPDFGTPALLGAVAAGIPVGSGVGAGAAGLFDKFVANATSPESQQAARKMKSKYPHATSLPFGDMVGSMIYGKPGVKQAYASGFLESAQSAGFTEWQAIDLLQKQAALSR